MKAVKNQKKSFLLLFFGLFFVGLVLSLTLYKVSNNYFLTQYKKHYTEILDYLGRSVVQQEKASEQLMYSAAEYIKKVDSSVAPLSTDQLKSLNASLGITHSFIIDKTGKLLLENQFVSIDQMVYNLYRCKKSTDELFLFNCNYKKLSKIK